MQIPSQKIDSKEVILDTATDLFARKGFAGTSVREIVQRAGLTKPVLYYYFKNKEDVLLTILERAVRIQKELLADIKNRNGPVFERLIIFYRSVYQGVFENKPLFTLIHNLIFGPPQGAPDIDFNEYQQRMIDAITDIYQQGVSRGEVKEVDPEDFAVLVLALIDYSLHLDMVNPEHSDPQRAVRLLKLAIQSLNKEDSDLNEKN